MEEMANLNIINDDFPAHYYNWGLSLKVTICDHAKNWNLEADLH